MKYKLVAILITLLVLAYQVPIALALDATGSANSQTASPSADIVGKLNALKAEIASKAALIKQQINTKIVNKAWVGYIQSRGETQINIVSNNSPRTVLVNEYTDYKKSPTGTLKLKDLNSGDFIIALGDVDDKNSLTAKRLIKTPAVTFSKNTYFGQIKSISGYQLVLTTTSGDINLSVSSKTAYQLGNSESSIADMRVGRSVAAVGSNNSLDFVVIQNNGVEPVVAKKPVVASSSATASPSAKKK